MKRVYTLLLRAYPRAYRERHGAAMIETCMADCNRLRRERSLALLAFWPVTIAQALWYGAAERARRFESEPMRLVSRTGDIVVAALRSLRRQKLYTAACVATLALGIAIASATLAVVKQAFLDPLPYRDGDRLVALLTRAGNSLGGAVSAHVLEDLRHDASSPFTGFAPIRPFLHTLVSDEGTEAVAVNAVTLEYFDVLGVRPASGRTWATGESDAVVLTWAAWQRLFRGDPAAVGRTISFDSGPRTIVGVMPQDFLPPYWTRVDFLAPLDVAAALADPARGRRTLTVLARRAPAASLADVAAYLQVFTSTERTLYPSVFGQQAIEARPLRQELVGAARPALIGTAAATVLLLLVVCANLAGLSAARAMSMQHQFAVRAALGAGRVRLAAERLASSVVIAAVGSALGVWTGGVVVKLVAAYQQQFLDRLAPIALDAGTAAIALVIGVIAGTAAAMAPQAVSAPASSLASLRSSWGGSGGAGLARLRSGLVVLQATFALVLLVGAGLLVRTVSAISTLDLGFQSESRTTFYVNLTGQRYARQAAQVRFERDALEALRRVPSVTDATASVGAPVIGGMMASLAIRGQSVDAGASEVAYFSAAPKFMGFFGVPILQGRPLATTDTDDAERVMVINEKMARTFWPNGDALGARIYLGPGGPPASEDRWMTVVGIAKDMRQHGPTEWVRPTAFGATYQYSWPRRHFTVRTDGPAPSLGADLRAAIQGLDRSLVITQLSSIDDLISDRTARHRLAMLALTLFSAAALVLCAFGLYAVVALASQLRRREYAIRMALGAARDGVRWMVIRQALALAVSGAAAGLVLASLGTRLLEGLLLGVEPLDPVTFATAIGAILTVAALAAWLPARRAGLVNPAETLKAE